MRKNRIIYVLFALCCLAFSIGYESRIASVIFTAVIVYPILAFSACLMSSRFIDAGFEGENLVYEKNTPFNILIYIKCGLFLPLAPVELWCNIPDKDIGLFSDKKIYAAVSPFSKCRISIAALHRYRGLYSASITKAAVYDPLRIIRISKKTDKRLSMTFLPRKLPLEDLSGNSGTEQSVSHAFTVAAEKNEFSHVREYISGDIIQMVHWKLTAKQDELMIKQFDETADKRAAVLCDFDFGSTAPFGALRRADAIIEIAIAFVMSLVNEGIRCVVDFGEISGSFVSEIDDNAGFDRFYDLMSVMPSSLETSGLEFLISKYMYQNVSVIIMITGSLSEEIILMSEQAAVHFGGTVILVSANNSSAELNQKAKNRKFLFIEISDLGIDI